MIKQKQIFKEIENKIKNHKEIKVILGYSNKNYKEIDFIRIYENSKKENIVNNCKIIKNMGYKILTD